MNSPENPDNENYPLSELEKKLQELVSEIKIIQRDNSGKYSDLSKFEEMKKQLEQKSQNYDELKKQFESMIKTMLELKQEKMIYEKFFDLNESEKEQMEKAKEEMQQKIYKDRKVSIENEQQKLFLEKELEIENKEKEKIKNKYYKAIIVSAIAIAAVTGIYSVMFAELAGQQYMVDIEPQPTGYTIQNLKGDTINTFLSWRLVEGYTLTVNILNADRYESELIDVIKKTIMSEEVLEIDNSLLHKGPKGTTSLMYVGWKGAMNEAAKTQTQLYIPTKFEIIESDNGEGDITIELTNQRNADGFSGWTNSIADESQNQILKSRITIFAANSLSAAELETIVRHEMGHALGLAHSSAPEDLMYPKIETNFPYVSDCNVDAMISLYDGGNTSEVICET